MSFTSWLFGDNDKGKAKQTEDSCYDDEVSSQPYAHSHNQQAYMDPMSGRSSFHSGGPSHNQTAYMNEPRSSFHFGDPSDQYGTQYNDPEYLEPTRSSFHFGMKNEDVGFNLGAAFQPEQSRSSFHFGTRGESGHTLDEGGSSDVGFNFGVAFQPEQSRSSFHFGTRGESGHTLDEGGSSDVGFNFGAAFQPEQSRSSFHLGTRGESCDTSVNVGGNSDVYIPAPYNEQYGATYTSSYPSAPVQFTDHEMVDVFNYPGYLGPGMEMIEEEDAGWDENDYSTDPTVGLSDRHMSDHQSAASTNFLDLISPATAQAIIRKDNIVKACVAQIANQWTSLMKPERIPYHTDKMSGKDWVAEVLNSKNPKRSQDVFGMSADLYKQLCDDLVNLHGFKQPEKSFGVGVRECLGFFLKMLRGSTSEEMDDRFQRSGGTISKQIKKITPCLEDFAYHWIRPMQSPEYWRECLERNKRYRRFKDCIGAIDGTRVPCSPPSHQIARCWSRKGGPTFNVIAVCDFNLCFTFAASGYEGNMHDYNIFKHETTKTGNRFPHPPEGKYYLVDAGYPNAKGYMAPYKGYMYHQDDFRRRRRPVRDSNERFNRVHSSLRSCVERTFGVWKARWRMMKMAPGYKLDDHKKFILISMAIHNYIRIHCPSDKLFKNADMENEDYVFDDTNSRDLHVEANEAVQSQSDFAVVDEYMDSLRNEIRNQILLDHKGKKNRQGNVVRSGEED
ncbi:hypothetical protein Vadar_003472 [Vaccinium darrowii]|uniref:Uncharacterized protein n=1 Tax=Vaccinium darrowii TaxID=229202 RepID=A0ACB7Z8T3_9ERIC|nr:hypothetical protein Vadar_003472 [Vaccinium darrowii]